PLPVLSQLAGHDFTMLDLVGLFADSDEVGYIKAVAGVISLVNELGSLSSTGSLVIPLGSFDLGGVSDLRNLNSLSDAAPTNVNPDFSDLSGAENEVANAKDSNGQSDSGGDQAAGSFLQSVSNIQGGGFDIPILDNPSLVFKLLLGQNVPLVTY